MEFAKANAEARQATFTRPLDDWPMTIVTDHPGEDPLAFDLPGQISNSTPAKRMLARTMGAAALETRPTKLALISSAWMSDASVDERMDIAPSEHPDRFEAVILVVADAEIAEGHTARIRRRRYGPPLLGPWEEAGRDVMGPLFEPWRDALR